MAVKELRPSRFVKAVKLEELSAASNADILAGFDHADGEHYSMTLEDQKNILALSMAAAQGQSVPYHADGQPYRLYTPEEFAELANAATRFIVYRTTYFNILKQWVLRAADPAEISAITYGTQLPADLGEDMAKLLAAAGDSE